MCYKHQCQAWAVNNGLVNAFTRLPASQLVAAFHYHALNYIPGQIVPACMASIFGNSQCRGQCFHHPTVFVHCMLNIGMGCNFCWLTLRTLYNCEESFTRGNPVLIISSSTVNWEFKLEPAGASISGLFPEILILTDAICHCKRGEYVV